MRSLFCKVVFLTGRSGLQTVQKFYKIIGQGRLKLHIFSRAGMNKAQGPGMKALALNSRGSREIARPERYFGGAVDSIAQQRMLYACHVDPDLMSPSGFQPALNMIKLPVKVADHPEMGNGAFSVSVFYGHLLAVPRVSAYGGVHGSFLPVEIVVDDGFVASADTVIFQLLSQALVGQVIFAYHKQSRGIFINTVDDAGP